MRNTRTDILGKGSAFKKALKVAVEDLLPTRVLTLFRAITDEDCEVLWITPDIGRPENLIIQNVLVPPVPIRPSVAMDGGGGSNEDDLTVKLLEIINVNVALELNMTRNPQTKTIMEGWDVLQSQVSAYINDAENNMYARFNIGDQPGLKREIGHKPIRGLCQRLKGKQGRFRGNLSGKRVDFSARTVISPDPNLRVDQVGVPVHVAKIMTYPEQVSRYNIEKLRERVRNGPDVHPGANLIRQAGENSFVKSLAFGDKELAALSLRIGDIVERHMEDGDIVLFNRQPSLHKQSIMSHHAKVMPWRTFRFNICVCAPYNADFDGGEYVMTQDCCLEIDVPMPAILKPVSLWTGKQVFTCILKPNKHASSIVNFEMKEKNYDTNKKMKHFCPNDGWVAFRNSELVSGNIAKKTIGDGSKTGLIFILLRDCGPEHAATFMDRFAKLCSRYFGFHKGFSIGISDVSPSAKLKKMKHDILSEGYEKADEALKRYDEGTLELRPGCNLLQSLEEILNGILGKLREAAGQEAMKALDWANTPRIMAECGSKGSPLNISQMMACVGQQAVGGMRIQNGFVNRTLPHFEYHSLTPSAKGFVANSFFSGLTATEFIFHTMGGREGLVDTAVKTAETGYMARRLMKALEDLSLRYDNSVRNSENTVVQFTYGDDSLNPEKMENNDRPVDFNRLHLTITQQFPCPEEPCLLNQQLMDKLNTSLELKKFQLSKGEKFLNEIRSFFQDIIKKQESVLETCEDSLIPQRIWNSCRFTSTQIDEFLRISFSKYTKALIEPGESVGAIGAQSISEPGTQMTLKTFHFAGVSSMNVTLGVPRLKEIINASKNISTPIITAKLVQSDNKVGARIVKAGIEKTTLGEIATYIKEVYSGGECYLSIRLDLEAIQQLRLNIDSASVRRCILKGVRGQTRPPVLRMLSEKDVLVQRGSHSKLRVCVPDKGDTPTYFIMQALKVALPKVIVQGISTVNRAVINEENKNGKTDYHLLVEGYGLAEVMGSPGVDGRHTTTNHIIEVEQTLGVEAARASISSEISYIMNAYGIGIDSRHLLLLSDIMTFKGEVLGITRFGVAKMRESVLMLASFEKTTDHLFDAAVHGRTDAIDGVSECIIMGIPIPIGTGLFKLIKRATKSSQPEPVPSIVSKGLLLGGGRK
eukprot:scaffold5251_cov75-Cyclotella_meneghiniana.AAC.3